jgi:hypothetical protein
MLCIFSSPGERARSVKLSWWRRGGEARHTVTVRGAPAEFTPAEWGILVTLA